LIDHSAVDRVYFYLDEDGDGVGTEDTTWLSCSAPFDYYVADAGDCDDADATVFPGASELCDFIDNDCDDEIDEGLATYTFYEDTDGDGYGTTGSEFETCEVDPGGSSVSVDGDCGAVDDDVYPGATEFQTDPYTAVVWDDHLGIIGDSWDYDCDGEETQELTEYFDDCVGYHEYPDEGVVLDLDVNMWWGSSAPSCGVSAPFIIRCEKTFAYTGYYRKDAITEMRTQACR